MKYELHVLCSTSGVNLGYYNYGALVQAGSPGGSLWGQGTMSLGVRQSSPTKNGFQSISTPMKLFFRDIYLYLFKFSEPI